MVLVTEVVYAAGRKGEVVTSQADLAVERRAQARCRAFLPNIW